MYDVRTDLVALVVPRFEKDKTMNCDPIAELNSFAAQLDLEWLEQLESAPSVAKSGKPGLKTFLPIAIVRVPDFCDQRMLVSDTCRGSAAVARRICRGVTSQAAGVPLAVPISSDLIEKPEDWLGGSTDNEKDQRKHEKNSSEDCERVLPVAIDNVDRDAISRLVDEIIFRFPLESPTVLMFAGSEWNPHVNETCAQVAYQLAGRNAGKVLLVDSEFEKSELTFASGNASRPGMAEVLNNNIDIKSCIANHDEANMDFLPAGTQPIWHWRIADKNMCSIAKQLKSRYQFTCVSVGRALGEAAELWAAVSEGSYLVISMANSSQSVARAAVDQLHANGARLLGCIVSDAVSH